MLTVPGSPPDATARSTKPSPLTSPTAAIARPNRSPPVSVTSAAELTPKKLPKNTGTLPVPADGAPMATSARPSPL